MKNIQIKNNIIINSNKQNNIAPIAIAFNEQYEQYIRIPS